MNVSYKHKNRALGRLVDVLHSKGILTDDEALTVLGNPYGVAPSK